MTPFVRTRGHIDFDDPKIIARMEALAANDEQGRTPEEFALLYQRSLEEDELYVNDIYQVTLKRFIGPAMLPMVHLSIAPLDGSTRHDWREMQQIKNELVGTRCEAVELYPSEDRLIDTASNYHLWVVQDGDYQFPFGFTEGRNVTP